MDLLWAVIAATVLVLTLIPSVLLLTASVTRADRTHVSHWLLGAGFAWLSFGFVALVFVIGQIA